MEYEIAGIIVVVLITLAVALSFSIGANDETSAPLAAAGTLKIRINLKDSRRNCRPQNAS